MVHPTKPKFYYTPDPTSGRPDTRTRRQFLKATAAALATLMAATSCNKPTVTTTAKAFDSFPDSVPSAQKVAKKIKPTDAKIILVHFRQIHESPVINAFSEKSRELMKSGVTECQQDIFNIFKELNPQIRFDSVFPEGLRRDSVVDITETVKHYAKITADEKKYLKLIESLNHRNLNEEETAAFPRLKANVAAMQKLREGLDESINQRAASTGTVIQVAAFSGIPIKSPENDFTEKLVEEILKPLKEIGKLDVEVEDIIKKSRAALNDPNGTPNTKAIEISIQRIEILRKKKEELITQFINENKKRDHELTTVRENVLIEQVLSDYHSFKPTGNQPYIAATIFGGAHNLQDNVEEHNRKHPDAKIALIEITPQNYTLHSEPEDARVIK